MSEVSKKSVESVEALAELALADCGAFDEAENLTGNGQNVFTHKYARIRLNLNQDLPVESQF